MEQMKVVTIHLPDEVLSAVDQLVEQRIFRSRSEAIRYMIIQWITQNMPYLSPFSNLEVDLRQGPEDRNAQFLGVWVPTGVYGALEQLRQKIGALSKAEVCRQALLTYILMHAKKS